MNSNLASTHYYCPNWCEGHDEDSVQREADDGRAEHRAGIGGDHLYRLTNAFSGRVLRDARTTYEIVIGADQLAERVNLPDFVRLAFSTQVDGEGFESHEHNLTPGEARTMAALLIAAADRLDIFPARGQDSDFHRYTAGRR